MSSRAHSFCRLENRLLGPGAAASLVCQIFSWSLKPANPAPPNSLHAETCVHTGLCTHAYAHSHTCRGPSSWLFREDPHMHTHPDTHICPVYLHISMHTDISHVHRPCQLQVHMFSCRSTYLNVCTCPCTNMYAHRHTALYIHVCTQVQACLHTQTHLHTTAHPHIYRHKTTCVHTDGISHVHTCAYRTTFKDLYMFIYIYMHVFCAQCTDSHKVPQCSAITNSQADPWFPAPSGWLSLPSPQPLDRQLSSCQPQCLPLASHPPGVPRSLINPLTNWPPAP